MIRVTVTYKDGSVWTCDVQPMGTADTSRACASSCLVRLDHDGRLVSASGGGLGGGQASEGGMVDDFATTNHPEPYRGADALARKASQGGESHEY